PQRHHGSGAVLLPAHQHPRRRPAAELLGSQGLPLAPTATAGGYQQQVMGAAITSGGVPRYRSCACSDAQRILPRRGRTEALARIWAEARHRGLERREASWFTVLRR